MRPLQFLMGMSAGMLLLLSAGSGPRLYADLPSRCASCHSSHTAQGPALTKAANAENLCLSCHSAAGPGPEAAVHEGGNVLFTCLDCHGPHRSESLNYANNYNLKSVRGTVATPVSGSLPVRFESRGTDVGQAAAFSFADDSQNGPWDGICEVCHTSAGHHRYNEAMEPHYDGRTCTMCHPHGAGFEPGHGGGQCELCHGTGP